MDHSWGYGSDQRLREENQDCHGVFEFPDFTLAVVCDGMGGHVGGAQASAIAVATIHDALHELDTSDIAAALSEALTRANQAIYEAARKNHRLMGMGTTVVAAAITDEVAYFAHVGDSRAYLLRNGNVEQMTRDHTMVNLFVDAELLTPEDAATHPEAHVLSRSLGVERTVDVEASAPVAMEPEDVVFLCSDGVHGVITDWELGNVDWSAPHEGIQHVIDIVAAREGDDNATAMAVLLATSFEDVPATPVPKPDLDDVMPVGSAFPKHGVTAVPVDEMDSGATMVPDRLGDMDDSTPQFMQAAQYTPAGPEPRSNNESTDATPSYLVYDEPEPEPPPPVPDLRKRNREPELPEADEAPAKKPAKSASGKRRLVLLGALGVIMLTSMGVFTAALLGSASSSGDHEALEPTEVPTALVDVDPEAAGVIEVEPDAAPTDGADHGLLFKPVIPVAPRRLPHRPMQYTQPPPGGQLQWESVQAARNHLCAEALQSVYKGMAASIDHASLYSQAWFCFNETHQRPLLDVEAATWEDIAFIVPHLEGPPEKRVDLDPEIRNLPDWYEPPIDGIEYRLQAWNKSDDTDLFSTVMVDLIGEPTVTDHLAKDVVMEAQLAVGLSKLESPNEKVIQWWARRVYVVASTMNGQVGRMLESHRPELVDEIRLLLDKATQEQPPDPDDPKAKVRPIPPEVTEAYEVGMGLADPPDPKRPKRKVGPVDPLEPNLEDLADPGDAKVHRHSDLVIGSP